MLAMQITMFEYLLENSIFILTFSLFLSILFRFNSTLGRLSYLSILLSTPHFIYLLKFFGRIGTDSLSEAMSFRFDEMYFYVTTVFQSFQGASIKSYVLLIAVIGTSSVLVHLIERFYFKSKNTLPFILMGAISLGIWSIYEKLLSESLEFDKLHNNFSNSFNLNANQPVHYNNIDILVYIGESTNKQHMSSYGYFRNTTPNLDKLLHDQELIKYSKVFSTHSHTSPSLLEALSIPAHVTSEAKPETIFEKQRVSIVDLLHEFGVLTHLYSNQSSTGTWNYASTIIFNNATSKVFNKELDGASFGNVKTNSQALKFDSKFIDEIIPEVLSNKGVSFFHSYAGHGGYCNNIPMENRVPIDDLLEDNNSREIYGNLSDSIKANIECYDSAIKYIDSNLMAFIEAMQKNDSAKALVYFSDHGESVYTGTGHDSSRFQLDMAAVPLFVFLNSSALKVIKSKNTSFEKKDTLLTLDYIPYLIAKILGINIGSYEGPKHIMVRDTLNGQESINMASDQTNNWLYNHYVNSLSPLSNHSCLNQTNNLGKLTQGLLSFECLEFDVVVNDDGKVYVDHDYPADSKLLMDVVIQSANKNKKSIWIGAKNINTLKNCLTLSESIDSGDGEILVEFPSASLENLDELKSCVQLLKQKVEYLSYYIPTNELLSCQDGNQSSCEKLTLKIKAAWESGYFNSFSFDFRGVDFMISIKSDYPHITYSSWGIKDFKNPKLTHLNMAAMSSEEMLNQN